MREDMDHQLALDSEILRGVVGSTAHGLHLSGHDDVDEMGVYVEPEECVLGLETFEHSIYRTQPEGVRSGPGDLDQVMYGLKKYMRLASTGNPTVLLLLYLPEYVTKTEKGARLVEIRDAFRSQRAGLAFLGYLDRQRRRMNGELAQTTSRPELVELHGYDTKFAMHALRLGYQGIEYMTDGGLTLPVPEPERSVLRAVRQGEVDAKEALRLIEDAEVRLKARAEGCTLKPE